MWINSGKVWTGTEKVWAINGFFSFCHKWVEKTIKGDKYSLALFFKKVFPHRNVKLGVNTF